MIDKINIIISLTASIIVTIVSIIEQIDMNSLVIRLIFTIAIFFILGTIARNKLKKIFYDELYDDLEIYNVDLNNANAQDENKSDTEAKNNILNVWIIAIGGSYDWKKFRKVMEWLFKD